MTIVRINAVSGARGNKMYDQFWYDEKNVEKVMIEWVKSKGF